MRGVRISQDVFTLTNRRIKQEECCARFPKVADLQVIDPFEVMIQVRRTAVYSSESIRRDAQRAHCCQYVPIGQLIPRLKMRVCKMMVIARSASAYP